MSFTIPKALRSSCQDAAGQVWLDQLPGVLSILAESWRLSLGSPWDSPDVTASWVAPVRCDDGSEAVLKVGLPHMEAKHELHGLRFWDGDPMVRLLASAERVNAMLLERCHPGTALRACPEAEQDVVIASILRRLWRTPVGEHPFRPLSDMLEYWARETRAQSKAWPDAGLVRQGLDLFQSLSEDSAGGVLLATDLHAGNVLRAEREPWLAIDPKPFVGDPAYDATQHLFNCPARMREDPMGTISRLADLLGLDSDRVRMWVFARAAAEPRQDWKGERWQIALALA